MAEDTAQKAGAGFRVLDRPLEGGLLSVEFDPADLGMAAITADLLVPGQEAPADFFLAMYNKGQRKVEMLPACRKGDVFQESWRERLVKAGQGKLYVAIKEAPAVNAYLRQNAAAIIGHPSVTRRKKVAVFQDMAALNLQLIFGGDLAPRELLGAVQETQETVRRLASEPQLLTRLSELLRHDYSIFAHAVNVAMLAMAFGRELGLDEGKVLSLGVGGLLHDVGMAKLPVELLRKRGPLNEAEQALLRTHPRLGYRLLMPIGAVSLDVLKIVLHHHENAAGGGYPDGLTASRTPYLAQIVKVVDAYDAMTSQRPYHEALPAFQAAGELLQSRADIFGRELALGFVKFLASPVMVGHPEGQEERPGEPAPAGRQDREAPDGGGASPDG